jgi:hypothetical protein
MTFGNVLTGNHEQFIPRFMDATSETSPFCLYEMLTRLKKKLLPLE